VDPFRISKALSAITTNTHRSGPSLDWIIHKIESTTYSALLKVRSVYMFGILRHSAGGKLELTEWGTGVGSRLCPSLRTAVHPPRR